MLMRARKMKQQCKLGRGSHSFSSGFWGSNSCTCVKGKSPLRPLTSPSHCPFMFILVTFTMSPTCGIGNRNNLITQGFSPLLQIKWTTTQTRPSRGKESCPLLGTRFNWEVTDYTINTLLLHIIMLSALFLINYTYICKDYWTTPLLIGELTASCNSIFSFNINSDQ